MSDDDARMPEFLSREHTWNPADSHGPVYGLVCPFCGFNYNHEGAPQVRHGRDHYVTQLGVRGDVIVLPFECEQGHRWALCFGYHKGNIYVFARTQTDLRL
jgi:hypothetical protein